VIPIFYFLAQLVAKRAKKSNKEEKNVMEVTFLSDLAHPDGYEAVREALCRFDCRKAIVETDERFRPFADGVHLVACIETTRPMRTVRLAMSEDGRTCRVIGWSK